MQPERVTGERRPVTVFFVDVVGSTSLAERMDPEDWASTMERAMSVMSAAVERYDGWVATHTGDGFMAFFGLPVAHEDDPSRAVSAAIDMVAAVRAFGDDLRRDGIDFQVRIGINTGEVVAREAAEAATGGARMYGDVVNVAARMQAEAPPGGILITEDTYARLPTGVDVRRVGPVEARGKAQAVVAYEVVGRTAVLRPVRGLSGLSSPMVGRDAELADLVALLAQVRSGLGRTALVIGEPGIGKSRLLHELADRARAEDLRWVEARTVSYGRNAPLHLVVDLVRALVGLPDPLESIPVEDAAARLDGGIRDLVGFEADEVAPLLRHLLGLPLDTADAERIARLEPRTLQLKYAEALTEAISGAAAREPVAIVCDDIHWADDASVSLLQQLLPAMGGQRVLLILASRPDRDAPGWRLATAAGDVFGDALVDVRLGPLSVADGRALVANLLEIESLPEATRHAILERAEGNPLFTEEIIRMLIDRGAIVEQDDRWQATAAVADIEIPDTLHGLLLARIDRLPADARRVLRVASVIGRTFPVAVLERITEPT